MNTPNVNLWGSPAHALEYLARADTVPHRAEGEGVLLECLPRPLTRVLDLGSGDGRLLALVKLARPEARGVAIDFSMTMIDRLHARFATDPSVSVIAHDMNDPLPASLGTFDAIVSSFAIHHLPHERKRAIYVEVYRLLAPKGVFCNLEHVSSPRGVTRAFLAAIVSPWRGRSLETVAGRGNTARLAPAMASSTVDCHWKMARAGAARRPRRCEAGRRGPCPERVYRAASMILSVSWLQKRLHLPIGIVEDAPQSSGGIDRVGILAESTNKSRSSCHRLSSPRTGRTFPAPNVSWS